MTKTHSTHNWFKNDVVAEEAVAFILDLYKGKPTCFESRVDGADVEIKFRTRREFITYVKSKAGQIKIVPDQRVSFAGAYNKNFKILYAWILTPEDYFRSNGTYGLMFDPMPVYSDSEDDLSVVSESSLGKRKAEKEA